MAVISVIMPLYNAEKYLRESLDSIQSQTFRDLEIICINDASDDNTVNILREYQKNDSRIRLIHNKKRSGAAVSRNIGLKAAGGKYVSFLDGDDIFDECMLEAAYQAAEKNRADVVNFEYKHVRTEDIHQKAYKLHGEEYIETYCRHTFRISDLKPCDILLFPSSPCNKIIRREFIVSNKLEFQSLPSANDVYFIIMAYILADRMIVLNESRILLYAREHQVQTRISSNRNPMCVYEALEKLQQELIQRGIFEQFFQYFYCIVYWNILTAIEKTKDENTAKNFYMFLQKKGIRKLCKSSACYQQTDLDIQKRLQNFYEYTFESGWLEKEDIFDYYIEKNASRIRNLFQSFEERGWKTAVWGAGRNGSLFIKFCDETGLPVSAVIDTDEKKRGQIICGHAVCCPKDMINSIQAVILTPQFIKQEVQEIFENRQIQIIDINEFIGLV